MSKNLYIAAAEADAGKSMIILGIMDFLSRHIKKIGFFRPIVGSSEVVDNHIRLISSHYNLAFNYESMYGLTSSEMNNFHRIGDTEGIQTTILNKYMMLEAECDFILVEGSDYRGHLSTYEFDFNLRVANNLGCPIIAVVSGYKRIFQRLRFRFKYSEILLHEKNACKSAQLLTEFIKKMLMRLSNCWVTLCLIMR